MGKGKSARGKGSKVIKCYADGGRVDQQPQQRPPARNNVQAITDRAKRVRSGKK